MKIEADISGGRRHSHAHVHHTRHMQWSAVADEMMTATCIDTLVFCALVYSWRFRAVQCANVGK